MRKHVIALLVLFAVAGQRSAKGGSGRVRY